MLVSRSVTCTCAPGTAAPFGSVTVPRMLPRLVPWANVRDVAPRRQASAKRSERVLNLFVIRDSMCEGVSVWRAASAPTRAFLGSTLTLAAGKSRPGGTEFLLFTPGDRSDSQQTT